MRLAPGDRVLARIPSWLGDAVMAEPALRALAERVGPGNLTLAGPTKPVELLGRGLPDAGRAAERPGPGGAGWRGHDAAVLFTGSFRSAWDAFRAGIGVRAGWIRDGRGPLLTHGVRPPRELGRTPLGLGRLGPWPRVLPRPFGAACNELVGWLGCPVRSTRPQLLVTEEDRAARRARAERGGWTPDPDEPYLLLNVGSRPGSAKGYPPELWAEVARGLLAAGRRAVLAAGPGEEAALGTVRSALAASGMGEGRWLVLDGPVAELGELLAWVEASSLVLTADSGPRHLAVALDRPLVVACGPTDPRHTADHLARTVLLREPVACGPCHRERCSLSDAAERRCLRSLEPSRWVESALAAADPGV